MAIEEIGAAPEASDPETSTRANDSTTTASPPPVHGASPPNLVPVHLVDARPPFPQLALYRLVALPRAGDLILINIGRSKAIYKVTGVYFDPFGTDTHANVLCLPNNDANSAIAAPNNQNEDLKKQLDDYIKSHMEFASKAEALNRAIILLGYAGIFAIWSFVKDFVSPLGATYSAILIGTSLLIYITYNVLIIVQSARLHFETAGFPTENPVEFFRLVNEFNVNRRKRVRRDSAIWLIQIILTVGFGYVGALLLLYNCAAKIMHLMPYP